jgi:mannose-6-phosphate isomerase-like protein (cupin superfamily)
MDIRKRGMAVPFVTKDGSIIREIMHPKNSGAKNQSLAEATVKPGEATKEHSHAISEEIYYILKGKGRIKVGGEYKEVGEQEAVLIPPNVEHSIENVGEEDLVFLCCSSPAYSDEDVYLIP